MNKEIVIVMGFNASSKTKYRTERVRKMHKAGTAFLLLVVVALFVAGPVAICPILAAFVVLIFLAFIVNLLG